MTRLVSPDGGCVSADVGLARYNGRIIDVADRGHADALKAVGYFDASLGGVDRATGFECPTCHRRNYIKTCGRCTP